VRLIKAENLSVQGKTHFYAIAAREMRRVLREHAQRIEAEKHGGGLQRVSLVESLGMPPLPVMDYVVIDRFIERTAQRSPRRSRVVELSLAGMTEVEIATALHVSERTVRGDLVAARARLQQLLRRRRSVGDE